MIYVTVLPPRQRRTSGAPIDSFAFRRTIGTAPGGAIGVIVLGEHHGITIAVLTNDQDDVELVNKTLRDAGHAAHCVWVRDPGTFDESLRKGRLELVVLNCNQYPDTIRQVVKQKDGYLPEVPVLAAQAEISEAHILAAMRQGACDLVTIDNSDRLQVVISRELRALRVERALNSTLQSATTYRKQLYDYMEEPSI